ncbi:MAG: transglutaminase domain-containing protein [Bacteroidales bacterium]
MKKILLFITFLLPGFIVAINVSAQYRMDFGNIQTDLLSSKPYSTDPGADAVVISDIAIVSLNYMSGFYIEYERDVRIRIVNSKGFDYANVEIPFSSDDELVAYRASTFNLVNGQKSETSISKKSFIFENTSKYRKSLKVNFPDVHEGSVIEYSFVARLKNEAVSILVPWSFQRPIPVMYNSLTVMYPEFFTYKYMILGNPMQVKSRFSTVKQYFNAIESDTRVFTWYANEVPAFIDEPYIKGGSENITRITFELASVKYPDASVEEISPTYKTLTKKLLDRDDFGLALEKALFLKSIAAEVTKDKKTDLDKLKAVHKYLTTKLLWDGDEDYTTSNSLRYIFNREKGNCADINMTLIAMLRSLNIKADPVILSTRSHGTISQFSAMTQQFNYLVALVSANGERYLVDATDPLRPFNMLPFECLNGSGRIINIYESDFVELTNSEKNKSEIRLNLTLDENGLISGNYSRKDYGYGALDVRNTIKLEGMDGYIDIFKENESGIDVSDVVIKNSTDPDSALVRTCKITSENIATKAGSRILFNPFISLSSSENPFSSPERNYPVDFGCPTQQVFTMSLKLPVGYKVSELPPPVKIILGKDEGSYTFSCSVEGNLLTVKSTVLINRISYPVAEYKTIRDFYANMLRSRSRMIVLEQK